MTIPDFFDVDVISSFMEENIAMRQTFNLSCGREEGANVKPLLRRLFQNAEKNNEDRSKYGYRHDHTIKNFAAALRCIA